MISLTWIKAIWGWFLLLTMIPGFGRSEVGIIYPEKWWFIMGCVKNAQGTVTFFGKLRRRYRASCQGPPELGEINAGWWLSHSSEEYEFVCWDHYSQYIYIYIYIIFFKKKLVPNHQPEWNSCDFPSFGGWWTNWASNLYPQSFDASWE